MPNWSISSLAVALAVMASSNAFAQHSLESSEASQPPFKRAAGGELLRLRRNSASNRELSLQSLARMSAPVLMLSPDEPLVVDRRLSGRYIPSGLPPRALAWERVVYYSVLWVETSTGIKRDVVSNADAWEFSSPERPVEELNKVGLRYFLYYSDDVGFGSHPHDVEAIDIDIEFEWDDGAAAPIRQEAVVRVSRIAGSAHGIGWYTNELAIDRHDDLVVPPRILVEEGKHASVPDRNGDGVYSPRYDVNRYPNDAWGLRDTLSSRYQPGVTFAAHMAKPRRAADAIWLGEDGSEIAPQRYRLVSAGSDSAVCNEVARGGRVDGDRFADVDGAGDLAALLNSKGFCDPVVYRRDGANWWKMALRLPFGGGVQRPFDSTAESFSLAYRLEGSDPGASVAWPLGRVRGIDGWLALKASGFISPSLAIRAPVAPRNAPRLRRHSLDLLYTPSASRMVDWYLAVGVDSSRFVGCVVGCNTEGGDTEIDITGIVAALVSDPAFREEFERLNPGLTLPEPTDEDRRVLEELARNAPNVRRENDCLYPDSRQKYRNEFDRLTGQCRAQVESRAQVELGVKVRFPLPRRAYLPPFAGLRVGIRGSSFDELGRFRIVVELGLGAW